MDHSGSMIHLAETARTNFNEQLAQLRKEEDDSTQTYVTLIEFDDEISVRYKNRPLEEVTDLDDYWIDGMTALNDSIGSAIINMQGQLDGNDNSSALVVIMTDGHENKSVEFKDRDKLKELMESKEKSGRWTFVFLGANLDVDDYAIRGLSMKAANTMSFNASREGYTVASNVVADGLTKYYDTIKAGGTSVEDFLSSGRDKDDDEEDGSNVKAKADWWASTQGTTARG